jgi:hypothetical protein
MSFYTNYVDFPFYQYSTISDEVSELHNQIIYLENFLLDYIKLFIKHKINFGNYPVISKNFNFTLIQDIPELHNKIKYLENYILKYRELFRVNNIKYRDDPKPSHIPGLWTDGKCLYTPLTKAVKYRINIEIKDECNLPFDDLDVIECNYGQPIECNLPMDSTNEKVVKVPVYNTPVEKTIEVPNDSIKTPVNNLYNINKKIHKTKINKKINKKILNIKNKKQSKKQKKNIFKKIKCKYKK